jgi:hypothetical protein
MLERWLIGRIQRLNLDEQTGGKVVALLGLRPARKRGGTGVNLNNMIPRMKGIEGGWG